MEIRNLNKSYGNLNIFKDFSISIKDFSISSILGPSGCGKTTLLNIISGIKSYESGEVIGIQKNSVSYLFQEPRLLLWKTVWQNIEFVLSDIYSKEERKNIIENNLRLVGLLDFKDFYPKELSGGMSQRVSIARAFAYPSLLLLLDEPFKQLDISIKNSLISDFLKLWKNERRTVIFVTHDIDEALKISDTIYVLSKTPARVKGVYKIDIPHEKRDIENDYFKDLEKQLNKELT